MEGHVRSGRAKSPFPGTLLGVFGTDVMNGL